MAKFKMAEHQEFGEMVMSCNKALGLWYDMGTGKTQMALSRAYHALEDGEIENVLIVCPASLTGNWAAAIDKMLMFEGYTQEGVDHLREVTSITSYQKLYHTYKQHYRYKGKEGERTVAYLRDWVKHDWGMTIVDEAHGLGGHKSAQTQACMDLAYLSEYRYALTGTPVSGRGGGADYGKLYGIISFLDPGKWSSWTHFCNMYVVARDAWHQPKYYNEAKCKKLLADYGITARLRDCFDMPEETWTDIQCPLKEKKAYKDIREGNLDEYNVDLRYAGSQYVKMRQICSGHIKRDDMEPLILKTSKDDALKDILQGVEGKVVIFCDYTQSVIRCVDICNKLGFKTIRYDSSAKENDWMEFQDGDANAIVCQYEKGGAGLDLYNSCVTIFYEATQKVVSLDQARHRIMRKGQVNHCNYYVLITPNSIESKIWESVRTGVDVTNDLFDEWARTGEI